MLKKNVVVFLSILLTVVVFFSFQQADKLLSVDELSNRANKFAEADQNDSASFYYENARKLAKQKKVQISLQEVLKKELIFWASRTDLEPYEIRNKINSFWEEFKADSKFRQYFYDAQSSLFLYESNLDSFEMYRGKTELEISKNEDWVYSVNYYTFLAQQFLYSEDYISALKYLKKAESSLLKTKNQRDEELIDFYFVANEIYNILGRHEQAIKYSLICLEIIKQKKVFNSNEYATALNNIAVNYNELEDYENGLKYYEEAKKYKLESGEIEDLSVIFENIGKCLKNLNRFDEAYDAIKKAIELSFNADKPELNHQISAYESMADLYIKVNKTDSALICADKLLGLVQKSKSRVENTYEVLGKIYSAAKDFEKARYYFEKAENLAYTKFGKKNFNTARILYSFASYYLKNKNLNKALNYIQKAINANSTEDYEPSDFKSNPELKSIVDLDLMINQLRLKSVIMDSMRVNNINNIKALEIYKTSNTVINVLLEINKTINYQSKSFWLNERGHRNEANPFSCLNRCRKKQRYVLEVFLIASLKRKAD
jgi:tetratricopeptide (TPR) repeat protein